MKVKIGNKLTLAMRIKMSSIVKFDMQGKRIAQ